MHGHNHQYQSGQVLTTIMINTKVGMCTGMIYNLIRKLTEDKEDILASR